MTNTCPQCGTPDIAGYGDCHTWPSGPDNTRWMSCQGCGSAFYMFCCNDDCDWSYTWGLNPKNPRADINEEERPNWVDGDFNEKMPSGWVWPSNSGVARPLYSPSWDEYYDDVKQQIAAWREEDEAKEKD